MGGLLVLPVSGFLPVPLPMMIPFMGAQSLVIGKMFGEGFQYGKRKISAMPNEEFNKLTFEDMMSNAREELKASIPTINASLHDMDAMVETVIDIFIGYLQKVIEKSPEVVEKTAETIIGKVTEIDEGSALDKILHAANVDTSQFHGHGVAVPILPTSSTFTPRSKIIQSSSGGFEQPVIPRTPRVLQKAGQSQIIARQKLIQLIAFDSKQVKSIMSGIKLATASTTRKRLNDILSQWKKRMLGHQQELTNLLVKYKF